MLYDPKWEVKADPLTLPALVAWLEKQPSSKMYDFFCQGSCMVGQWVLSIDPTAGEAPGYGTSWYVVNGKFHNLSKFVDIANSNRNEFTFGAALDRARAALRSREGST